MATGAVPPPRRAVTVFLPLQRCRSQRLQESDQSFSIFFAQSEPKSMPFHGIRRVSIRLETGRNVVIVNPPGIEPVLQRRTPAAMAVHAAIPDTLQRWDFVVTRSAACLGGESRIGIDGERQDRVFAHGARRRRETFCW